MRSKRTRYQWYLHQIIELDLETTANSEIEPLITSPSECRFADMSYFLKILASLSLILSAKL